MILLTLINCLWPISNDAHRNAICVTHSVSVYRVYMFPLQKSLTLYAITAILCSVCVYLATQNRVLLKEIVRIMPAYIDSSKKRDSFFVGEMEKTPVP